MLSKYLYLIKLKWWKIVYSFLFKVKLKGFRIPFGIRIQSIGKTLIFKQKNSIIKIGNNCGFRSKEHSNLIGINRKCSLSTLLSGAELTIGDNCGFSGTVIGAFKSVKIGNYVRCGANTLITDADWHLDDPRSSEPRPIIINDNVWLGVNAVVMKGVTIGENTVIGANSVVTKDIPANVIAAGNPCRVIKNIF